MTVSIDLLLLFTLILLSLKTDKVHKVNTKSICIVKKN